MTENIRSHFCRNVHSPLSKNGERVKGIEPSSSAWKAVALPLSYTRICNRSLLTGRQRSAIRIDTKFLLSSTDR